MDRLTAGLIVHYSIDCQAAIVTKVWSKDEGVVNLHVMQQSITEPVHFVTSREFSEKPIENRWHWPERA